MGCRTPLILYSQPTLFFPGETPAIMQYEGNKANKLTFLYGLYHMGNAMYHKMFHFEVNSSVAFSMFTMCVTTNSI